MLQGDFLNVSAGFGDFRVSVGERQCNVTLQTHARIECLLLVDSTTAMLPVKVVWVFLLISVAATVSP